MSTPVQRMNGTSGSDLVEYEVVSDPEQWPTYEIACLPSSLAFYLDAQLSGRSTSDVSSTPMHWVLQADTSLTAGPGDMQSGDLQNDWVVPYVPSS